MSSDPGPGTGLDTKKNNQGKRRWFNKRLVTFLKQTLGLRGCEIVTAEIIADSPIQGTRVKLDLVITDTKS